MMLRRTFAKRDSFSEPAPAGRWVVVAACLGKEETVRVDAKPIMRRQADDLSRRLPRPGFFAFRSRVHERGRAYEQRGDQERRQELRREPSPRLHDVDVDDPVGWL